MEHKERVRLARVNRDELERLTGWRGLEIEENEPENEENERGRSPPLSHSDEPENEENEPDDQLRYDIRKLEDDLHEARLLDSHNNVSIADGR